MSSTRLDNESSSSLSLPNEELYMCLPGHYTGDKWHVALAMAMEKNLKFVFIEKPENKEPTAFIQKQKQVFKLLKDFGLESRIIHRKYGRKVQMPSKQYTSSLFKGYVGRLNPNVKEQYASTSLIISHLLSGETSPSLSPLKLSVKRIQDILTEVATGLSTEQTAKVDKRLEPLKDSSKQYLLVNMRLSHYNTEHNIDTNKIEQIAALCKEKGLTMVAVGAHDPDPKQQNQNDKSLWEQYFGNNILDIYGVNDRLPEHKPFDHDARETIYFWLQVSAHYQNNIVGFIGGRSGSMDIAAFSGVRTLSWDKEKWNDPQDPQFVRLFLAHPILSIATLDRNNDLPSEEIKKWLDGSDIYPTPPAGISSKMLTQLEFPHHKLPYLNSYREEKGPAPSMAKRALSPEGEQTNRKQIKLEGDVPSGALAEHENASLQSYRQKARDDTEKIAALGQYLKGKSYSPTPKTASSNDIQADQIDSNNNASNNSNSSSDNPEASSSPSFKPQ